MAELQRDPSIHVRLSTLRSLFRTFGIPEEKAEQVLAAAHPHSLKGRIIVQANAKNSPRLEKLVTAGEVNVANFNKRLFAVRMDKGHRGIQRIGPNDAAYSMLRQVALDAQEFVDTYELGTQDGYGIYCELGIQLMNKKYSLNKFKGYKERIFNKYNCLLIIHNDDNKAATAQFLAAWEQMLLQRTSVQLSVREDPERLVNMVYGRQEADKAGADYLDWVKAQFDGLAFLDHIPELSQLHGDAALTRYERYEANRNIKHTPSDSEGMVTHYESPEEEAYFKAMRERQK